MSQNNKQILILDCENAHSDVLKTFPLKDELQTIKEAYAMAYVPIDGSISLNDFKENDEFKFGLASIQVNSKGTVYSIPVEFAGIQGRILEEEQNQNFNKQVSFASLPMQIDVPNNSQLKVKFRNNLTGFSFKFNLKIIITYIER